MVIHPVAWPHSTMLIVMCRAADAATTFPESEILAVDLAEIPRFVSPDSLVHRQIHASPVPFPPMSLFWQRTSQSLLISNQINLTSFMDDCYSST